MRSAEAATLAGVTPRTLRHYHQMGILPEPDRDFSGYRMYTLGDVADVIRIRRLAALGVPLIRTREFMSHGAGGARELDDLDRELAEQIALLQAQRAALACIRASGADPDLAPELASFIDLLTEGLSPDLAQLASHETIVGYQVTPLAERPTFEALVAALSVHDTRAELHAINALISAVPDDAPPAEIEQIAAHAVAFNRRLLPLAPQRKATATERLAQKAADAHWRSAVTPGQARVMDRMWELYAETTDIP